jgi:hypothetical protein
LALAACSGDPNTSRARRPDTGLRRRRPMAARRLRSNQSGTAARDRPRLRGPVPAARVLGG